MANDKNLIPQAHTLTVEEQSKGGKRSAEVRREKKTFRQLAEVLLDMEVTDAGSIKKLKKMGLDEESMSYKTLCMLGIIFEAQNGNVKAFEKLQELTGEAEPENNGVNDGFIEALNGQASEVWDDEKSGDVPV